MRRVGLRVVASVGGAASRWCRRGWGRRAHGVEEEGEGVVVDYDLWPWVLVRWSGWEVWMGECKHGTGTGSYIK